MLHLDEVSLRLGGRWVLDGVSLRVSPGQTALVTGPNGSGKSALAQVAVGLLTPSAGAVTVGGAPVGRRKARRKLGYLPQAIGLYDYLTVKEQMRFAAAMAGVPWRRRREACADMLELVGLTAVAGAEAEELTPGQRKRLAVAGALVGEPEALVLDDPLAGLDSDGRADLRAVLRDLTAMGKAVLIVTGDAADFADANVMRLQGGRLMHGGEAQ